MEARLFGGFEIQVEDRVVTRFRSAKTRELAAYLCYFRHRPHTREELADRFWPEAEPEAARQSLRMALSDIRKEVGEELLLVHRATVQLSPAVRTDVEELAQALTPSSDRSAPDVPGPLLPGFFGDWIPVEQARLAEAVGEAWRRAGDPIAEAPLARIRDRLDPDGPGEPRRSTIPLPPRTSFVGRTQEMESLHRRFQRHRLVTLLGIGGAGKTRLALEYAAKTREDVVVVDWSFRTAADFWRTLAEALGLLGMVVHVRRQVLEYLRDRPVTLLLDNFETVLPEAGEAMAELLRRTREPVFLVTSRVAVGLPEESCLLIGPVDPDDARHLFRDRADQSSPEVALSDEAVDALCAKAGHLPLALEVIASQLEAVPVATLQAAARSTVNESISTAVDSAWQRLSPRDREHLVSLSILPGDFDYPVAAATAGVETPDALRRLLRSGLLTRRGDRYLVLEPVGDHIRGRLPDVATAAQNRLCEAVLEWTFEIESCFFRPQEPDAIRRVVEQGPLFALATSLWIQRRDRRAVRIVRNLAWAWCQLGETVVGERMAREATMDETDAYAFFSRSLLCTFGGHPGMGYTLGLQALEGVRLHPDPDLEAQIEENLAFAVAEIGDFETAHRFAESSVSRHEKLTDQRFLGGAYNIRGLVYHREGRLDRGHPWYEKAYAFYRATGYRWGQASVLNELAAVMLHAGDPDASIRLQEESLAIKESLGDRRGVALCLVDRGAAALRAGNRGLARRSFLDGIARFGELGDDWGLARASRAMSDLIDGPENRLANETILQGLECRIQAVSDRAEVDGPREGPAERLVRLL